jgi:transposase-like protein
MNSAVDSARRKTIPRLPPRCPSCHDSRGVRIDNLLSEGKMMPHWRCQKCGASWPTRITPRAER